MILDFLPSVDSTPLSFTFVDYSDSMVFPLGYLNMKMCTMNVSLSTACPSPSC